MRRQALQALIIMVTAAACSYSPEARPQTRATDFEIAELWQEPVDLATRDLFSGPGGAALAPPLTDAHYSFFAFKRGGTNPGYVVRDSTGRLWSVKLGIEAQAEVTASRILWAMGFHEPPTYFVRQFTLEGVDGGVKGVARFRTEFEHWKSVDEWSWHDNAFTNTRPFHGLIVAQLILNNWDLKTPNNRVYAATDETTRPRKLYVVRDLGSSLGRARQNPFLKLLGTAGGQGSKNDVDDFESQGFIKDVVGDDVDFDYRGLNQPLVDMVTAPDVFWACELLSRLSDEQWQAAFRAGAYPQESADRYIRKIKEKVAQGLALKAATR
jgi:hypothetical protein